MMITIMADQVRDAVERHPKKFEVKEHFDDRDFLSTGCTLLNLALTDTPHRGFMKGKYYWIVGDSASGKTWLANTCLAEAAKNPTFKDYRFIYDNVEDGMLMDVERFFGKDVEKRLEPPKKVKGEAAYSETIEDFYFNIDDAVNEGTPFIYILDSMDGLSSKAEGKKFDENKKAARNGTKVTGDYGDGKAKRNSAGLRRLQKGLRHTGSILIIISQTRDNIDAGPWGPKQTVSGGRGLRFYATWEFWSAKAAKIKKEIRGKERTIGNHIRLECKKNRITGKLHTVTVAIYPSFGIDDVGSCVDYLIEEKWWAKAGGVINAKELKVKMDRDALIKLCEVRRDSLHKACAACWEEIAQGSVLERKPRYE